MMQDRNAEAGLFVLRVSTGLIFLVHGWEKLFGEQISFVQEMLRMAGWSVPEQVLWLVAVMELLGGLALLLGLFVRLAALGLTVEMLVAVGLFHVRQGFFIFAVPNAPLAYGFEFHLALVGSLVCLAFGGAGSLAIETLRPNRGQGGEAPSIPEKLAPTSSKEGQE
jgi:putative oxidoreductase